ncbi:MAG: hypothetical protein K1Y02_02825 [Candidatus Hydrogenedentes bacterium]|nr:hypothetical protein [Candidatus Hydrogenedentota bacterium]
MTSAWGWVEETFLRVLNVSWQAALLVALVVVVQRLLRGRISATVRHAMWGLVLVRLLLLWSVPAPFSVYNAVEEVTALFTSSEQPAQSTLLYVDGKLADSTSPDAARAAQAAMAGGSSTTITRVNSSDLPSMPLHSRGLSPWFVGAAIWLAGSTTMIAFMVAQGRTLARRVTKQRLVVKPQVLELLEDCKQRMGVNTWLAMVVTPCVEGPALLGAIRPRLLLPPALLESASSEHLRYVFLHELAHLKRGDILIGWLVNVLLAVHWFNPALWWARKRITADRELACDAHVLSVLNFEERRGYGHALLDQFQKFRPPAWSPGLASVLEGKTNMERRIAMVTQFSETTRWSKAFAACVLALFGVLVLTDAQEPATDISITPADVFTFVADNGGRMIAATITNSGPKDREVAVTFYEGDPDAGGKKINTGALIVPAGGKATEAISWAAQSQSQKYTIVAVVDPENAIQESDESNNRVTQEVSVADRVPSTGSRRQMGGMGGIGAPSVKPSISVVRSTTSAGVGGLGGLGAPSAASGGLAAGRKTTSVSNALKQLGLYFKMYANETPGEYYPPLRLEPAQLLPDLDAKIVSSNGAEGKLLRSYFGDDSEGAMALLDVNRCVYLGFALQSDEDVKAFASAYTKAMENVEGGDIDSDLPNPGPQGPPEKIRRLREGIERFFITDINNPAAGAIEQSQIPTVIEWPDQNKPFGGHVLYMDGHVEYLKYPDQFPMSEETINALRGLAKLPPIKTR